MQRGAECIFSIGFLYALEACLVKFELLWKTISDVLEERWSSRFFVSAEKWSVRSQKFEVEAAKISLENSIRRFVFVPYFSGDLLQQ